MSRPPNTTDHELIERLGHVFSEVGYAGASLTMLAQATGLQKASLYHRFPDGKEQMAAEVLTATHLWLKEHLIKPLQSDAPPEQRVRILAKELNELYRGGKQACLLNMLSSAYLHEGPFAGAIKSMFKSLIHALRDMLEEAGLDRSTANLRAERVVMLLQGSLVLCRGMGTTRPFQSFLSQLSHEMFGDELN